MTKTINELLAEFGDDPFTAADYLRERQALLVEFDKLGLDAAAIDAKVSAHDYHHGTPVGDLCDRWIDNEEWRPYLDLDEP